MKPFTYHRPATAQVAVQQVVAPGGRYLGGGTNLVDLMRSGIEQPEALVDVSALDDALTSHDGGWRIAAAATNTAVAAAAPLRRDYPVLPQAILSGASPQIRNVATVAGNLLQRTRCPYFYDQAARCNKRQPGVGCDAREGFNRDHAILGASSDCVATHPSDMAVALALLDARVQLQGTHGQRELALVDLHRLPGSSPQQDTMLEPGELITAVILPPPSAATRQSSYRKVRDRASFAFALISVAVAASVDAEGRFEDIRVAWGGVAHKPWRANALEQHLRGQPPTARHIEDAIAQELQAAEPLRDNAFKLELVRRTTVAMLADFTGEPA